jgi:hypothetical protein
LTGYLTLTKLAKALRAPGLEVYLNTTSRLAALKGLGQTIKHDQKAIISNLRQLRLCLITVTIIIIILTIVS